VPGFSPTGYQIRAVKDPENTLQSTSNPPARKPGAVAENRPRPYVLRAQAFLRRSRDSRSYLLIVAAIALISTVTMLPFLPVLVISVLLHRARWGAVAGTAALASALGQALIFLLARHLGWEVLDVHPSGFLPGEGVDGVAGWMERHGLLSLAVASLLPVPLMPLVALAAAVQGLSVIGVFFAVLLGIGAKFLGAALLCAFFPAWVGRHYLARFARTKGGHPPHQAPPR
jgi:uncharacterized membrane protein YdjX (TVP38/TMEM64 family)